MKFRRRIQDPRDTTVNIRVSKSEKEQLKAAAAALGLSVAGYLLGLALGDSIGQSIVSVADKNQTRFDGF